MMRHKASLFAGISLFASFCIWSAGEYLESYFPNAAVLVLFLEAVGILLPTILLRHFLRPKYTIDFRLKLPHKPRGKMKFWIYSAIAVAFLSIFAIYVCLLLTGYNATEIPVGLLSASIPLQYNAGDFFVLVILAAVAEEMYFRGALFSAYENVAGTKICILASGVMFALLHGSTSNLVGPLLSGIFYAWLTYAFNSIIPAIAAHGIENLIYYILSHLSNIYSAFGIWKYLPMLSLLCFLLFAWFAFRQAEKIWPKIQLRPWKANANIRLATILEIALTPGFLAFVIAYVVKVVLQLL